MDDSGSTLGQDFQSGRERRRAQSILSDSATATTPAEIDTETELVLFPEIGSQIEIAERLAPTYTAMLDRE